MNRPRERQWAVYPIERARPPVPPPISDPLSTPRRIRSQHSCKWTCALADCDARRRFGWKSKSPQAGRRADHHPMGRPGQTHDPAGAPLWCAMLRQTPGSAPPGGCLPTPYWRDSHTVCDADPDRRDGASFCARHRKAASAVSRSCVYHGVGQARLRRGRCAAAGPSAARIAGHRPVRHAKVRIFGG